MIFLRPFTLANFAKFHAEFFFFKLQSKVFLARFLVVLREVA